MGWTIATYIGRAVLIVMLPITLVVVYHLIKQELKEIRSDIKVALNKDKKCQSCKRVSIEVWACHSNQEHCINCCYCPDHKETIHAINTCKTAPVNTWCGTCAEID